MIIEIKGRGAARGDTWKAISPNLSVSSLSVSSLKEKKSFAAGAIGESPIEKGLLYVGTEHGAFWVSKKDGANWEDYSIAIANNDIRSIAPSRLKKSRVYMAMTGINYDHLHSYVYSSEDYGKKRSSSPFGIKQTMKY